VDPDLHMCIWIPRIHGSMRGVMYVSAWT
jgi:hypothetical protein